MIGLSMIPHFLRGPSIVLVIVLIVFVISRQGSKHDSKPQKTKKAKREMRQKQDEEDEEDEQEEDQHFGEPAKVARAARLFQMAALTVDKIANSKTRAAQEGHIRDGIVLLEAARHISGKNYIRWATQAGINVSKLEAYLQKAERLAQENDDQPEE